MKRTYITVLNHDRLECSIEELIGSVDRALTAIALRRKDRNIEGVIGVFPCWQAAREHAETTHAEYHLLADCEDVLKVMESDPLCR